MKRARNSLIFLYLLVSINCFARGNMQNNIFGFEYNHDILIAVVADQRLQFYEIEGEGEYEYEIEWSAWNVIPSMELILPYGYKDVFYFENGIIGVVADYRIQFYEYDGNYWNIIQNMDMILPAEYKDVFALPDSFTGKLIGVIVNDIIRLYRFESYYWVFADEIFPLPNNFRGGFYFRRPFAFFAYRYFGLIINNTVVFLVNAGIGWSFSQDLELILPEGSKGAFGIGHGSIGIIFYDKVQFFYYEDNRWNVIRNADFIF